jgi:nucleotidyltransferase/DNA polymerase involved in DNA repair
MGIVIFIDMDYFFAACEELHHPEIKGKPFAVGTAPEASKIRGVIQTCNYEARAFGVRSGMSTAIALQKKPDMIYLESDDVYYEEVSKRILEILKRYGMAVEECSIDEFAIDAAALDYEKAFETGKRIKGEINADLGLPCTVGVSFGKTFAKMACDDGKPNGAVLLKEAEIPKFLSAKEVRKLPGIGPKTEEKLHSIGIRTIGELAKADTSMLLAEFGSIGSELHNLSNGVDNSKIIDSQEAVSIGRERTMESETNDLAVIDMEIDSLSDAVVVELKKKSYSYKNVTAKARYSDFTFRIKSRTLQNYSDSPAILKSVSKQLIRELITSKKMRKVGVRVSTLISSKGQNRLL